MITFLLVFHFLRAPLVAIPLDVTFAECMAVGARIYNTEYHTNPRSRLVTYECVAVAP